MRWTTNLATGGKSLGPPYGDVIVSGCWAYHRAKPHGHLSMHVFESESCVCVSFLASCTRRTARCWPWDNSDSINGLPASTIVTATLRKPPPGAA